MLRYFISQHPTFGSYANPVASKIEQSPYFFWWLALTLNEEYLELCNNPKSHRFKTNQTIQAIYQDFGDVRYTGDKHLAFTNWWKASVSKTETRGEYLFAEPLTSSKVRLISDTFDESKLLNSEENIIVAIPKTLTRKQIDKGLEKILKQQISFERGRQTINPNRSHARYALTKPVKVSSLRTAFKIYELKQQSENAIDNFRLAKIIGIEVNSKTGTEPARVRRKISIAVSRKKKLATDAIQNVVHGWFL